MYTAMTKREQKMVATVSLVVIVIALAYLGIHYFFLNDKYGEKQVLAISGSVDDQKSKQVDKLFERWNRKGSPGYAIGVIKDGQFIHKKGYGMANLETQMPIEAGSRFYVASVSKQFTAACIALLVLDKKISLEDEVHKYVPEVPDYGQPIKIRHLIYHTSGLPDYLMLLENAGYDIRGFYNNDDAIRIIRNQKELNFSPGSRYEYNNVAYIILTRIVENVSKMSFPEFARKRFFAPLGMSGSSFGDDRPELADKLVMGYERNREDGGFMMIKKKWATMGGDGLVTTVDDLYHWMQNFYEPKVGGKEFIALMNTRGKFNNGDEQNYSFGLVHKTFEGHRMIRHDGGFFGFSAELRTFPDDRLTIICLSNMTDGAASDYANKISRIYLED